MSSKKEPLMSWKSFDDAHKILADKSDKITMDLGPGSPTPAQIIVAADALHALDAEAVAAARAIVKAADGLRGPDKAPRKKRAAKPEPKAPLEKAAVV